MVDSRGNWRVRVLDVAEEQLRRLARMHAGQRKHLIALLNELRESPDQKGIPLRGALSGFRRVSRGRFRIVYKVFENELVVVAVAAGWREDGSRVDAYREIDQMVSSGALDLGGIEPESGTPTPD